MLSHPVLDAIAAHTQAVGAGEVVCRLPQCPKCDQQFVGFKYHAWRTRWFRVIAAGMVRRVRSAITRWKCVVCRKTFTLYPDFALPHKRYVRQDLCRLSQQYVFDDELSYRKAVQIDQKPVHYDVPEADGDSIDDRSLSHTSLHRWISFLGALKQTLSQAWQMIRAKSPGCDLFRWSTAIGPWKYRSPRREDLQHTCGRLLQADEAYRNLFKISIFPHFGTVCHWS